MRVWEDNYDTMTGLTCLFSPKCEFHPNVDMVPFLAKHHKFSINDGDRNPNSHATDVEFHCPKCGFWEPFGVAISPEKYERMINQVDEIIEEGKKAGVATGGWPSGSRADIPYQVQTPREKDDSALFPNHTGEVLDKGDAGGGD